MARYLLGDLTDQEKRRAFAVNGRFAGEILDNFGQLLMRARDAHLARVGIDLQRLVRKIG